MIRVSWFNKYSRYINGTAETIVELNRKDMVRNISEGVSTIKNGIEIVNGSIQHIKSIWENNTTQKGERSWDF